MKQQNPFVYSNDNKRYHTWNYYLKKHYQEKLFKVALNANFSCPNRDGTCGIGGCTFCTSLGSGDCAGNASDDLMTQYQKGLQIMRNKWPNGKGMAYFQAYTNTYAPLPVLRQAFTPFFEADEVKAVCIATRADCLEDEKIAWLKKCSEKKDIWIELGLQSIHDQTAALVNRGHSFHQFLDCIDRLENSNLKICVHLINGLPYETDTMMLESAKALANLPIHAVKLHMLHIMKDTKMAEQYACNPFSLLTKEQYIDIVIRQLELLPPQLVIQRLTGDGVQKDLIAPKWTSKKVILLNDIDKEMVHRNTWQGKYNKSV